MDDFVENLDDRAIFNSLGHGLGIGKDDPDAKRACNCITKARNRAISASFGSARLRIGLFLIKRALSAYLKYNTI